MSRLLFAAVVSLALTIGSSAHSAGIITTIAGGGDGGGTPGIAQAVLPNAIVVDSDGNLFVIEQSKHRVRFVDFTSGVMTTVAGGAASCGPDLGDGGPATAACLSYPFRLALDGAGNLFIVDQGHYRVRRVDRVTGIISTVAGTDGNYAPLGDGGPATSAHIDPTGIAIDAAGNLFIGDYIHHRIRRVDATTQTITTVVTTPISGAAGIAFDPNGDLVVADGSRVHRVNHVTYAVTPVAGNGTDAFCGDGGPATDACLYVALDVAVDSAGNVLIADRENYRIRRVDAVSGLISTVAGNGAYLFNCPAGYGDGGSATEACVGDPFGIGLDAAGNLFIADLGTQKVRRVDAVSNTITSVVGSGDSNFCGDGGAATDACLASPYALARDAQGNVFIADSYNNRVRRVDAATNVITTVAGGANGVGGACDGGLGDGGPATSACLQLPVGVALDLGGNLFVADGVNNVIRRVDGASGIITTVAGGGSDPSGYCGDGGAATAACLSGPRGLAVDGAGNLYVADGSNARIRRVEAGTGRISTVAGNGDFGNCGDGGHATAACLDGPADVAVDGAGNLYIPVDDRVRRVDGQTGIITTFAGGGASPCVEGGPATANCFSSAVGVTADALGNVFVADLGSSGGRIFRIDGGTGMITTVGGNGTSGLCGDGGAATSACVQASDVVVDRDGSLFVNDSGNDRIRRITCDAPDTDGDGTCDPYDFDDLGGLTVQSVEIKTARSGKRVGKGSFRAEVTPATFAPSSGPQAFFAQAQLTGFTARLSSNEVPRALAILTTVRVAASDCRFSPPTAPVPTKVSCKRRSGPRGTLKLRQVSSDGLFEIKGAVRDMHLGVPPGGTLQVALSVNDAAALDLAAPAPLCTLSNEGSRLTCSASP